MIDKKDKNEVKSTSKTDIDKSEVSENEIVEVFQEKETQVKEENTNKLGDPIKEFDPDKIKSVKINVPAIVAAIVIILLIGFVLVFKFFPRGEKTNKNESQPTSVPEQTLTPTQEDDTDTAPATESAEIEAVDESERYKLNILVLNGTGGPGVAKLAQQHLEGLSYVSIDKDNADSFDFTGTLVNIKEEHQSFYEQIKADLKQEYSDISQGEVLDSASEYDLVITVGEQ